MPAILLATFATMFSLSAFVIGPAITGGDDDDKPAVSKPGAAPAQRNAHPEHH